MQDHFTVEAPIRTVKAHNEAVQNLSTTTNTRSQRLSQDIPEEIPCTSKYDSDSFPLEFGFEQDQSAEDPVDEYHGIIDEDHRESGESPLDLGVQGEDDRKDEDGPTVGSDDYEDGLHQDRGHNVSSFLESDSMYNNPYSTQRTDEFSIKSEEEEAKELAVAKKEEFGIHDGMLNFIPKKEEYCDIKDEPYIPDDLNLFANYQAPQVEQNLPQFGSFSIQNLPGHYNQVQLFQALQRNGYLLQPHMVVASQSWSQIMKQYSITNSVLQKNIFDQAINCNSLLQQKQSPLVLSTATNSPLSVTELKKRSKARHNDEEESMQSEEKYSNQKKKAKTGSPRVDTRKRSSIEKNYIELAFCGYARCLKNEIEGRSCDELEIKVKDFIYKNILGREDGTKQKKIASKQEIHDVLLKLVDGDEELEIKKYLLKGLKEFFKDPSPDQRGNSVNWANWLLFHCNSPNSQKLWFAKNVREIEQSLAYNKNINRFNFKYSLIYDKPDEECKEELRKYFSESSWASTDIMNFFNKK